MNPSMVLIFAPADHPQNEDLVRIVGSTGFQTRLVHQVVQGLGLLHHPPQGTPTITQVVVAARVSSMEPRLIARLVRNLPGRHDLPIILATEEPGPAVPRLAALPPATWRQHLPGLLHSNPDTWSAPPAALGEPIFDPEPLTRAEATSPGLAITVLRSFMADLRQAQDLLPRMLTEPETQSLIHLAHKLKGGAGSLGVRRVSRASRDLEHAARSGAKDRWPELIQAVLQECQGFLNHARTHPGILGQALDDPI